jgi:hypothetical protein
VKYRLWSIGKMLSKPAVYIHQHRFTAVVEVLKPQNDMTVVGGIVMTGIEVPGKLQPVVKAPVKRPQISCAMLIPISYLAWSSDLTLKTTGEPVI